MLHGCHHCASMWGFFPNARQENLLSRNNRAFMAMGVGEVPMAPRSYRRPIWPARLPLLSSAWLHRALRPRRLHWERSRAADPLRRGGLPATSPTSHAQRGAAVLQAKTGGGGARHDCDLRTRPHALPSGAPARRDRRSAFWLIADHRRRSCTRGREGSGSPYCASGGTSA